jgi:hypothetical protein
VVPPAPAQGQGGGFAQPGVVQPGVVQPGIAPARGQFVMQLQVETYDLDKVETVDNKGKKVDKKTVVQMLKEETVALATYGEVDPLHLRVLKDGVLTFALPVHVQRFPGFGPPVGPLPPAPGGFPGGGLGGAAPGGFGIAEPGVVNPAIPATPPATPKTKQP